MKFRVLKWYYRIIQNILLSSRRDGPGGFETLTLMKCIHNSKQWQGKIMSNS